MTQPLWRRPVVLPLMAAALVAAAYLPGSGRSFDYDSSQTVGSYVRTPSLADAVSSQRLFNNHPAFSLVEHGVYSLTGSSEEWVLRLAPIAFAAATVGVLVAALQRRIGPIPAACAGLYLAANPTMIELSRSVRGYSLLVLCTVVSSVALAELLVAPAGTTASRRWSSAYVASLAIGIATHLYMAPVVLGQMAVVAARRRLSSDWALRWAAGLGIGACIYVPMVDDLVDSFHAGSRTFKPAFPLRLGEVVVGSDVAAVLLGVVVLAGAVPLLRRRTDLRTAALVVGGAVAFTWLATASVHLEARFHLWLVPAAAALAGLAVHRHRWLTGAVVLGAALNAWSVADGYLDDSNAQPELGSLLDHLAAEGERGCVTSYSVLPMLAYTDRFDIVLRPEDLARCDVVAVPFANLDRELAAVAGERMAVAARYDAGYQDGFAFARDALYFERLCAAEPASDLCPP